jgi:hypothetical protein
MQGAQLAAHCQLAGVAQLALEMAAELAAEFAAQLPLASEPARAVLCNHSSLVVSKPNSPVCYQ